jgi:hypothetical protein
MGKAESAGREGRRPAALVQAEKERGRVAVRVLEARKSRSIAVASSVRGRTFVASNLAIPHSIHVRRRGHVKTPRFNVMVRKIVVWASFVAEWSISMETT